MLSDDPLPTVLALLICLSLTTFFSLCRAVLTTYGSTRAQKALGEGKVHFRPLAEWPERLFVELQFGRVLGMAGTVVLLFDLLQSMPFARTVTILGTTVVTLVMVEALPAWVASSLNFSGRAASPMLHVLRPWHVVSRPVSWSLERLGTRFRPAQEEAPSPESTDEFIAMMLQQHAGGSGVFGAARPLPKLRPEMVFGDTMAREVMVPRNEVVACEVDAPLEDVIAQLVQNSRIPVYEGSIDNIVGVRYAKDVLEQLCTVRHDMLNLQTVPLRDAFFVPEMRKISEIFKDFQTKHIHMAVVIDEFGGVAGLVTLEDIIEEFFGEILDEYDDVEELVQELGRGRWMIDARMDIDELGEMLGLDFPEDREYETLAGFINVHAGRVPRSGLSFSREGYRFTVRKATPKRVVRVEVARDSRPLTQTDPSLSLQRMAG